jgi:hypothetical protein
MTQRSIDTFWKGTSLVVNFPSHSYLDWNWMKGDAAPLALLARDGRYDRVLMLGATVYPESLRNLGVIVPLVDHGGCAERSEVRQLRYSDEAMSHFRQFFKPNSKMAESVVILRSNASVFEVTNLDKLANGICGKCSVREVVAEKEKHLNVIMADAKFVIAPHSGVVSQAIWTDGILVEIIPNGAECESWTFEVSKAAGIQHIRIAVGGGGVKLAPFPEDSCTDAIDGLYNTTREIDVRSALKLINVQ